jgi:hypothetical protein
MSTRSLDKAYVSPYDQFLYGFDATHAKTPSQEKEIKKNKRIAKLRDDPAAALTTDKLWDKF